MLKVLFAIILFLSIVIINLFYQSDEQCSDNDFYINKKFEYNPMSLDERIKEKCIVNPNTKFIYLSFDDGPLNGSQNINRIAWENQAPMNVMIVGEHVFMNSNQKRYFQAYKKNPFIEVNNHSYSHANNQYYSFYANPQNVLSDFNKSMNQLALNNKIARLPGRNVWSINNKEYNRHSETKEAVTLLRSHGFKLIGWDIEWHYNRKTKAPIGTYKEFFTKLKNHIESNKKLFTDNNIVVLLHDPMFRKNADELENLVRLIQSQEDYILVPLSQYPIIAKKSV